MITYVSVHTSSIPVVQSTLALMDCSGLTVFRHWKNSLKSQCYCQCYYLLYNLSYNNLLHCKLHYLCYLYYLSIHVYTAYLYIYILCTPTVLPTHCHSTEMPPASRMKAFQRGSGPDLWRCERGGASADGKGTPERMGKWRFPQPWGYPNSWMVFGTEKPTKMDENWGCSHFRKPPSDVLMNKTNLTNILGWIPPQTFRFCFHLYTRG